MSLSVTCPNPQCGKSYPVAEEYLGRRGRCKSCGTEFVFAATTSGGDRADSQHRSADQPAAAKSHSSPGSARSSRSQAPSRLGRFQILERVGMGGFGAVYRAQDPQLQRTVALKLLQSTGDEQRDQHRINRFLVEGRAGARLQHPNIVPVFDAGKDDETGEYYLAAAFIAGRPLSAVIDGKPMELRRAATIVIQLARALDYAHGQGILHRDVKPDNVMLDEQGVPHLMDFGLARMEESESHLTRDGAVMGTPSYMSPEQCVGKQDALGPAADQYSLGCLLYELFTGEKLFDGPVSVQIHHQINTEAPPPSKKNTNLPQDLDTICLKTLAKEPDRRYASCAAFAADLEHWLADEPIQARQQTTWERWQRWRKKNPAIAGLSIGLAAALLIGLIGISTQWIRAESHARKALLAAEEQKKAKEAAEEAEQAAIDSADQARKEKERADDQTAAAVRTAQTLNREVYKQRIARSYHEWHSNQIRNGEKLLEDCPVELRGWEWHYCKRLCHQDVLTFDRHEAQVAASLCSPDGRLVASASDDGCVKLWELKTGVERHSFKFPLEKRYRPRSQFLAFTPDSSHLAAACEDGVVRVWDTATGQETWKIDGQTDSVASLAISPDGKQLAVGRWYFGYHPLPVLVTIWDFSTKQLVRTLEGHLKSVTGLAYSRDGQWLATADTQGKIQSWDAGTGTLRNAIAVGDGGVYSLDISPDGQSLVSCGSSGGICLWNPTTGQLKARFPGHQQFACGASFNAGGKLLATSSGSAITLWDVEKGLELRSLRGHSAFINSISFHPDGRQLASGSSDGTVKIWDSARDQTFTKLDFNQKGSPRTNWTLVAKFSPDGRGIAATGVLDSSLSLFRVETGQQMRQFPAGNVYDADFSADGSLFAAAFKGFAKVWSVTDGAEVAVGRHDPPNQPPHCVRFSPDGLRVAWPSDKEVRVMEVKTGTLVRTYPRHEVFVHTLAFSPDGERIASLSDDGQVRVWNVATGEDVFVRASSPHPKDNWKLTNTTGNNLAYSPDGFLTVGGGEIDKDGLIEFWDAATGETIRTLRGHADIVNALAFNRDGTRLVSAANNGSMIIWDPREGDELFSLQNESGVIAVDFSRDGSRIATGSMGGFCKIYDASAPAPADSN